MILYSITDEITRKRSFHECIRLSYRASWLNCRCFSARYKYVFAHCIANYRTGASDKNVTILTLLER